MRAKKNPIEITVNTNCDLHKLITSFDTNAGTDVESSLSFTLMAHVVIACRDALLYFFTHSSHAISKTR